MKSDGVVHFGDRVQARLAAEYPTGHKLIVPDLYRIQLIVAEEAEILCKEFQMKPWFDADQVRVEVRGGELSLQIPGPPALQAVVDGYNEPS